MLFAVSGAQGCGKSTILAELEAKGYPVVARKTSRSIMAEWGMTLDEINNDVGLSMKFQREIIERKFQDEQDAIRDDKIWFTERTYMDLFVYALINLGKHNEHSVWLDAYYDRCIEFQQSYAGVFYVKSGLFTVVDDGVRGANKHYSRLVDLILEDYTMNSVPSYDLTVINTASLDSRIQQIERAVTSTHLVNKSLGTS